MKKFLIFIISLILFIPSVKASILCEESEEHKNWSKLSEVEKSKLIEPSFCKKEENIKIRTFETVRGLSNIAYSSLDLNIVSKVKNQGNTNACWAFSGVSLIETAAMKAGFPELDLSERHINMMSTYKAYLNNEVNISGFNRKANDGGNYTYVASYIFRGDGAILERDFPYILPWSSNYAPINKSSMPTKKPILSVDDYLSDYSSSTCTSDRIEEIKSYVREYGAVGATINSSNGWTSLDQHYFINTRSDYTDHAVTIVGYDDRISKDNFAYASRDGAFIVKNSWGEEFGDNGYFYISYDDLRICRNITGFKGISVNEYDHIYNASDSLANTSFYSPNYIYLSTKINVTGNEYLDKVSFETLKGTPYEVYLSKDNNLSSSSSWTKLASGTSNHEGVISVKFSKIKLTSAATIIVKFNKSGYVVPLMCKSTTSTDKHYYMQISKNTNYYSTDGSTWNDFYNVGSGTLVSCEPVIYAYTSNENHVPGTLNNIYVSSSSNKVYVNSSDYFNIDFTSSNIDYKELISINIYKDGNNVNDYFDIDRSNINNNYYKLKVNNITKSGTYTVALKYKDSQKSVSFEVHDKLTSNTFKIEGKYIKILPSKNVTINKNYVLSNINYENNLDLVRNSVSLTEGDKVKTGDVVTTEDNDYVIILIGDANMDGKISPQDYIRIKNHILKNKVITDETNLLSADANEDGKITPQDYIRIKNRILRGEV